MCMSSECCFNSVPDQLFKNNFLIQLILVVLKWNWLFDHWKDMEHYCNNTVLLSLLFIIFYFILDYIIFYFIIFLCQVIIYIFSQVIFYVFKIWWCLNRGVFRILILWVQSVNKSFFSTRNFSYCTKIS